MKKESGCVVESGGGRDMIGMKKRDADFVFQAEDGIRVFCLYRGLGDVYKRQGASHPARANLGDWEDAVKCYNLSGRWDIEFSL